MKPTSRPLNDEPTRIAIISDVHGNIHALSATLEDLAREQEPGLVVCAGDTVGYGAFPNECCQAVMKEARQVVIGNHDRTALDGDASGMNPYAATAARWTMSRLEEPSRHWLGSLRDGTRFSLGSARIAMFHGSPRSVDEYVFEDDVSERMLGEVGCSVLILGHTHVPYVRRFRSGIVVNPGSVGQPRDGDARASFALLDTSSLACKIVRLEYDSEKAANAIRAAGLPGFLADRLMVGN